MSAAPSSRHLVERAMEALGGLPAPPPPPAAAPAEPVAAPAKASLVERAMEAAGGPPLGGATVGAPPPPPPSPPPAAPAPQAAAAPPRTLARPAPIGLETLRAAGFFGKAVGERSRVTEELKVLQQQVLRTIQTAEPAEGRIARLVMITSAKPGEGKSFCALNIAAYLALGVAEQVILVDADGKPNGTISHRLGQQDTPGLRLLATDLMQRPERLVLPTAIDRLSFLPYGPPAAGAGELPSGNMLAEALGRLAASMPGRIIVLDTPPCLSTSEPGALAPVAGQVVVVVEAERTQRNEVEAALDMVESCPTLQLLLNRTRVTASDTFGAYGYYGG
ncbi:P-loop NTPase family protein [Paracraurococcus ruber]|uniref:Uncharacterized protein n=1 Tax=Paracraurococcus ruber TaxID=77675 RepID=A0ABS1CTH8_9PROT|nr:hypothetical protein [Paracraurococcus ruber]MBK1657571.1 hypothetical protein [Paracraurococcus ruber]TDG32089.1 hypothetical protein E2C05_08665 [Paracraurococcus ruber]